jgi:hypothetical protein
MQCKTRKHNTGEGRDADGVVVGRAAKPKPTQCLRTPELEILYLFKFFTPKNKTSTTQVLNINPGLVLKILVHFGVRELENHCEKKG